MQKSLFTLGLSLSLASLLNAKVIRERDIMGFMHRSVRFIRANADRWNIDPDRIGVTGASAGGHLSLILATKGVPVKSVVKEGAGHSRPNRRTDEGQFLDWFNLHLRK